MSGEWLEEFWSKILSRDPSLIVDAWNELQPDEQVDVWNHLTRMATEEGWVEAQVLSAKAALKSLRDTGILL